MAKTLEELLAEYNQSHGYQGLTQEQINTQATNRYQGVYDQKRLSANQAFQTADQALASQLSSLQSTYDKQRENTQKNFQQTRAAADRQSLSRGMQRSSYNNSTLANIDLAGQEAQADINEAQAQKANAIGDQRSLYAQQLAQQLAQYDAAQASDVLAYADELAAREYQRTVDAQTRANELAMAIYNAQRQREQDELAQQNWLMEFELAKQNSRRASGSSGSRSSSSSTTSADSGTQTSSLSALMAALSGARSATSAALAAGAKNYENLKAHASKYGGEVTPTGQKTTTGVKKHSKQ